MINRLKTMGARLLTVRGLIYEDGNGEDLNKSSGLRLELGVYG